MSYTFFVTSTTYTGNLGGIEGANAKCQARAGAAGLNGSWKAILAPYSTNFADFRETLSDSMPLNNNRGSALGGWETAALSFSAAYLVNTSAALGYDEFGNAVPGGRRIWFNNDFAFCNAYTDETDPTSDYIVVDPNDLVTLETTSCSAALLRMCQPTARTADAKPRYRRACR